MQKDGRGGGKKTKQNLRIKKSNLELAEERKSIWNLNPNPKGKAHEKAILYNLEN